MLNKYDIDFEVPVAWCNHPIVGKVHQQYVISMRQAFIELGVKVNERDAPHGSDFEPRLTNGVLFSYHSAGNQKHVWRIKEGYLPYLFTFDRSGYSGWLSGTRSDAFANQWHNCDIQIAKKLIDELKREITKNNISKYPQGRSTASHLETFLDHYGAGKKPVFLPLQLPADTVIKLSRFPYIEAVSKLIKVASDCDQPLIIKRHPFCEDPSVNELLKWAQNFPNVCLSTAPIHEIFKKSKSVVCCNSGVGFEALLNGLQVWTFGSSDYEPITHQIFKTEDFEAIMRDSKTIDNSKISTFLVTYLSQCCFDIRNVSHVKEHIRRALSEYENTIPSI